MNPVQELMHRSGVVDPWTYQDPASTPAGPVRIIQITPQVRALDEAQRRARELKTTFRERRAAEIAPVPRLDIVRSLVNSPRRTVAQPKVYRRCKFCNVELGARDMQLHLPVCAMKPKPRRKGEN